MANSCRGGSVLTKSKSRLGEEQILRYGDSKKIKFFQYYYSDMDAWARSGSKKDKAVMVNSDWMVIDSLLQDLLLIESGLTSEQFKAVFEERLRQEGVDQPLKNKLIGLMG